jgi:hypothetical protein
MTQATNLRRPIVLALALGFATAAVAREGGGVQPPEDGLEAQPLRLLQLPAPKKKSGVRPGLFAAGAGLTALGVWQMKRTDEAQEIQRRFGDNPRWRPPRWARGATLALGIASVACGVVIMVSSFDMSVAAPGGNPPQLQNGEKRSAILVSVGPELGLGYRLVW